MAGENNLKNLIPNLDKENLRTNLQELFRNPNLIGELYKNLSLTETDTLTDLERLSHYCTAKKLYEFIPNIDKFASSKKTLKSCFKGKHDDISFLFMSLLPSMFSSFKELYMGKTSRESWLNRLNDEDLKELDNITVNPNGLSKKQIISEIRNALNHTHYAPGKNELYVRNPMDADPKKHAQDFEADIPYLFLLHFIGLTRLYNRRVEYYSLKIDDKELLEDLWENERNVKYEDVKDKIHFYQGISKEKHGGGVYEDNPNMVETKEVVRSQQVENLMSKYFSNHKLDKKNLYYVAECVTKPQEIYMWEIFITMFSKYTSGINYNGLRSPELVLDVYQSLKSKKYIGLHNEFDGVKGNKTLMFLFEELTKKRQSNGQSLLKHFHGCVDYVRSYLKKYGFLPRKDGNGVYFEKGDITIGVESIYYGISTLCTQYYIVEKMVQTFPDWFRAQLIKLVYVNEQVSLQNENVEGLITKTDVSQDAGGNGKKSTSERVRDALSHITYTLLQGVDDVVLRDGYDKKTDTWAREATFSLSQLFENTFKDLEKNGMASNYSFLLDFLKNLDN